MNRYQRAAQLWAVLALAAINRQILTYAVVSKLVGVPMPALGALLEPIQTFCLNKNIPALTVLVVQQETGIPGSGFIAAQDIPAAQMKVFNFGWLEFGAPNPENIQATCENN